METQERHTIKVKVSQLMIKCHRRTDMINITRELVYKYVGYYFPNETGYDRKFFLEFLPGKKLVNCIIINDNSYCL